MNKTTFAVLAWLLIIVLPSLSMATDHFIKAGASGSKSGSDWANAFPNIPASLVRGDVYYIAGGSYAGDNGGKDQHIINDKSIGATLITFKRASLADHGTDIGWVASYADGIADFPQGFQISASNIVFDGVRRNSDWTKGNFDQYGIRMANLRLDDGYLTHADNVTFKNIDLHGGGRDTGDGDDVVYGIMANTNITFQNCALHDSDRTIFLMRGQWKNLVIDHSYIARNTSTPDIHGELMSYTESDGVIISNNIMEDIEGSAFFAQVNGGLSANWKVFGNVAFHSAAYLADKDRAPGHNFGVAGFFYVGNDANYDAVANNFQIHNNTLINIQGTWSGIVIQKGAGNSAHNNIWYNSVRTSNVVGDIGHNWYYNTAQDGDDSTTKVVCTTNCNIFASIANKDFHLTAATAAGAALGAPFNVDMDGNSRGADGVIDRGAYEYISSSKPPSQSTPTQGESLFSSQVPSTLSNSDGVAVNYELGMKFTTLSSGQIKAIKFYKSASESGSHVGKIYSASGTLLASVVFSSESASGWQVQALATPLSILANTIYVVSVNTGNSYYVATINGFASQISNGNLKSVVGSNGVYGPVGAMPFSSSWQNSNYFRDVVFSGVDATPPTIAITNPLNASMNVGLITVSTSAADNVGVAGVQFKINGVNLGAEVLTAPYSIVLDTTKYANGIYTILAVARDAAANTANAQISITINNLSAVTNLRLISATSKLVNIQWGYSGTNQSGFYVNRKLGVNGTYARIASLGAAVLTYTDSSVAAATDYYYQVQAYNVSGVTNSNELKVTTASASVSTTLLTNQVPTLLKNSDGAKTNYELGMKFTASQTGVIKSIRFYKSASEKGSHTGKIYSSSGALLAFVVFTNESTSGWQTQALATALPISANTLYTVSVNTGSSYYVDTVNGFASQISNGALKSAAGNNGVYGAVGTMPTISWQNSNYFRDVEFLAK
jgi:hypothetical protein